MNIDFNEVLTKLRDEQTILTFDMLAELPDMTRSQRNAFSTMWPEIERLRRLSIIKTLVETTEQNIEFDFGAIFRQALEDADAEIRATAISGLWVDEQSDVIGPLLHLMKNDPDEQVREQAAESLGRFILMGELGDLDMIRAFAIQEALLEVYNTPLENIGVRCYALESLAYSSDDAISDLIEAAYHARDERLTHSALIAMGHSADPHWQTILLRELESGRPEFRFEAAQACGTLELVEAVHALGEIAQTDEDRAVRAIAIWALGQIGDIEARRIINTLWDRQEEDDDEIDIIRDALLEAQEEIAFQENVLDMSYFVIDWEDPWDDFEDEEGIEEDDDYSDEPED
jgi:HEAT repeat protein